MLPHRQVGDRVEPRLAQDDLALDRLELAGRLVAVAVDERRLGVEALAVGRGQELEVEVDALPLGRRSSVAGDAAGQLDERRARAG